MKTDTGMTKDHQTPPVLPAYLVNHIQKLQEDGREAAGDGGLRQVTSVGEPVSEGEPLLLHEDSEPLQGAVVRVQAQLGHGRDLQRRVSADN